MKLLTRTLLTVALLLFINNSFAAIQDRHLSGFNAISLSAAYDVYIVQGTTESVKVEAPDDMIDHLVTEVQNGVLKIYNKNDHSWGSWNFSGHKKLVVYVTAKDINNIGVSGSGNVYFKNGITTNSLKVRVSGSGNVQGKLTVKILETGISGSGDVKFVGRADNATIGVSGSGDYTGRDLVTVSTAVRVSGSGDATVNASEKIDAVVSGSGDIRYTGTAKQISKSTHGSGDIHKM